MKIFGYLICSRRKMNSEERMRKMYLPKQKKKDPMEGGIIDWVKAAPLILGLLIAVVALIYIMLK